MKPFAALFATLDATTATDEKTAALAHYFRTAPEPDRIWTIALLSGRRPKRVIAAPLLRAWAAEVARIPLWLFEESYAVAGDLAETITRLLPPSGTLRDTGLAATLGELSQLARADERDKKAYVLAMWDGLDDGERFIFNKLLTGGFRMGVSQGLMTRALAAATGMDEAALAHRLMGDWNPATLTFAELIHGGNDTAARPYPFALASPIEGEPAALGPISDWQAEWKWDGIRAQIIIRESTFAIWSRGEDLMTDRFPDLAPLAHSLPQGTVLDGEIVAWDGAAPLPFAALQKRIGRKTVPRKLLADAPAFFLAYDLLEHHGRDLRAAPLATRRAGLEAMLHPLPPTLPIKPSPIVTAADWQALATLRATARAQNAEGLMLKSLAAPYPLGRKRGAWWKWKLDPYSVDAVMIYAQAGHGRRANLFTDFTFAVRDGNDLVPFAKAYSGLTDAEFSEITKWVAKHTLERFGPVRRVTPELVFELGFEGIQQSPRHKSGLALRFPRMIRWRRDKGVADIDTIETLRALL